MQEEIHATHFVKSLTSVLEQAEKERDQLKNDIKNELEKIASATDYFTGVEDILMNQKHLQLKKLAADFEVINKLVERKHAELRDKISNAYDKHLKEAYQYVEGLNAIRDTIMGLEHRKIKVDID
jgi:flagellar basal body-associated protein FliL